MVLILSVVGLLTYAAPIPVNHPYHWHKMREDAHLTLTITPNLPGANTFHAQTWLPEK